MRLPRLRRLSPRLACSLYLFIPVLAGCGDYCLFCDGDGGGNGNGTTTVCDRPFPGADAFVQVDTIGTFPQQVGEDDRLSLAVVPKGMSFEYGSNRTADPGDVILADQQTKGIFIYEFGTTQAQRALLTEYDQVSGLALLHVEVDDNTAYDLMFFTVNTENTLYVYDLTGTSPASSFLNPLPITNELAGAGFFQSPTALAINAGTEKATIFILNDSGEKSSVKRLAVKLDTWLPESPRTLATMSRSDFRLVDIAFFNQIDTLFISKKILDGVGGWVYEISNASDITTPPVDLDSASFFIQREQRVTGLEVALASKPGTNAYLLLLKENINLGQVEQYDTDLGGETPEVAYTPSGAFDFLQEIEYDCTNGRLLMTNVPFNDDFDRTLFEAFPSQ